jgi:hypothetical protein
MVSAMTETPSSPFAALAPLAPADGSPEGGALPVWFLAGCHHCGIDGLAEPFLDEHERDVWAAEHVKNSGHVIFVSIDGSDRPANVIRPDEHGRGYRFLCVGPQCVRWNGPYGTALIALASAAAHRCPVSA